MSVFEPALRHLVLRSVIGLAVVLVLCAAPARWHAAHADRVDQLAHTLVHSRDHKERIGAAVSLGRLVDRRSMGALIKALGDKHRTVRALAATALGKLGDPKALPALEQATKDSDELVRKRAQEAIELVRASQRSPEADAGKAGEATAAGTPDGETGTAAAATAQPESKKSKRKRKSKDKSAVKQPAVYVALQSAADKSRQVRSTTQRTQHAAEMRRLLDAELGATPEITTNAELAATLGISRYNIDASITSFTHRSTSTYVEIGCEIRVAVSDERGKMLSFFTGGAKVQVPRRSYKKSFLPQLRLEALENAVKSVHQDLLAHLRQHKPS